MEEPSVEALRDMTPVHDENPEDHIGEPVKVDFETGEVTPWRS